MPTLVAPVHTGWMWNFCTRPSLVISTRIKLTWSISTLDLHWLFFVIDLESGKADLVNIWNSIGCVDAQIVSISVWKNGAFSYSADKIR